MNTALKLTSELVDSARAPAVTWRRSTTAQIEYWARIGRAFDAMEDVHHGDIRRALRSEVDFDALNAPERATALASLEAEFLDPRGDPAFHAGKTAARLAYTVLDDAGELIEVAPDGTRTRIDNADAYLEQAA